MEDTTPQLGGDLDTNSNSIKLGDRSSSGVNELVLGAGDDLKLYHNGSSGHSIIQEGGSGNLQIYASNLQLKAEAGHDYLVATSGGSVELYHNSNKRAETTGAGLQTTGTLNVNGAYTLPLSDGSANQVLQTNGSGSLSFATVSGGGSLSGNMAGDIASNGHEIKFADSGAADENRLTFGASDDLEMYHDGSNSYIVEGGTGDFRLQAANLAVQNTFGQYMIEANNGGAVSLYHNTELKLSTESDGVGVRGQLKIRNSGGAVQYTLPASDGSANQVLQTDGSGAISFATVSGGGSGADLYAANESSPSAQPSATGTNAIAIGDGAIASGTRSFATSNSRASGQNANAIGIGNNASSYGAKNNFTIAIGQTATASAAESSALGHYAYSAGSKSVSLGRAYSSGTESFAAVTANSTSSYGALGNYSIAMGYRAKADGSYTLAVGNQPTATGGRSICISEEGVATGNYSTVLGGYQPKDNGVHNRFVLGSLRNTQQFSIFQLHADTTDATQTTLVTNSSSASATNQITLVNESVMSFTGTVAVREDGSDGDDYAGWEIKGVIMRAASASTTALGVGIVNSLYHTSGLANAVVTLSADTTNGSLKIQVTGIAATNLRWAATVQANEVVNA